MNLNECHNEDHYLAALAHNAELLGVNLDQVEDNLDNYIPTNNNTSLVGDAAPPSSTDITFEASCFFFH